MIRTLKAYKYRLYPNKSQQLYFQKTFGCTRFIYNQMLVDRIKSYQENKDLDIKNIKYPTPAQYKKEYEWLKEVDSLALANAQMNLDKAYKNFFRDKSVGFPKFKSKKTNYKSYTTNNQGGNIHIKNKKVKLPKIGYIKIKQHRDFDGIIKSCTISQVPSGKYFISILVDVENIQLPSNDNKVGIDLGLKDFAITSDGEIFSNPKWLRKTENKLKKAQKELSKKKKGGKNRNKARIKLAKLHEKIYNQKQDFLQKISNYITNENQVIVIENLKVKNMMQNHKLAKAISEVSWFEFRRQLEYKSIWKGRKLIIAPSNYASSQLCSNCGNKSNQTKDLGCRTYICTVCGMIMDRDKNASVNLLKLAI